MVYNDYTAGGRPLTGAKVLLILIAFFGCIALANVVLVHYALSTFRGQQEDNPYEVGLAFNQEIKAARLQEALHWNVNGAVTRRGERIELEVVAVDAQGQSLNGLAFTGRLAAPADKSNDRSFELAEEAPGVYRGLTSVPPGAWDLMIEAKRDGIRHYLSKSRIILR
jgi:nitrogen fixation protein FixH